MEQAAKLNFLAVGVGLVIVIVTIFIFYFSSKLEILDPSTEDCIMSKTDKYEWSQTSDEIEVYIPLIKFGENINIRQIQVILTSKKLKIQIGKEVLLEGEFSASVNEEDSLWTFDHNAKEDPHLYLTLYKLTPTQKNQHWKSLLVGDPEIDVFRYGPPVHALDPNSPEAIQEAIRKVRLLNTEDYY